MNQKKTKTPMIITLCLVAAIYVAVFIAEQTIPATSMLFTVLKKGAVYALVAVSMNLLNGFTGIFSLGQAGFMLIGAYIYGIFTIPVSERMQVYQYFDGGAIQFTLPIIVAMILAGLVAAFFAFLIGLPVLRLKSDYLAIATLGFAEITRAVFQWNGLGRITNGSNMLRLFPGFNDFNIRNADGKVTLYLSTLIPFIMAGVCILLIVVIGGIGSVTGSVFSSFLFVACSEWWLRFLDEKQMIGNFEVPLLRNGFRLVVFSLIIMIVVLFFRRGIMGDKELPDLLSRKTKRKGRAEK